MNKITKRLSALLIVFILILTVLQPVSAKDIHKNLISGENIIDETVYQLDNGMTIHVVITEDVTTNFGISTCMTSYTKSGSKYSSLRDADGNELFRFTVTGVFTVTPDVGAVCTRATYSYSISDDAWELENAEAYAEDNQAIGNATFICKVLFVTTDTETCSVTLTCDANGSLS